jgi:single stranded DNA-binding protein
MNREQISQAEIAGRLGQQPELQYTPTGTPFTRLSVATSERWTDGGGQIRERTEWHRAVAWGPLAEEISQRYKKGDSLAIVGAMRINSYEKDGAKNRTIELHVDKAEPNPHTQLSKNEARLVGFLREDAKFKVLDSGTARTTLSIATTTMANGKPREDWHSVTLWGKAAEAAQDIKAGDTISVNDPPSPRTRPGRPGDQAIRDRMPPIPGARALSRPRPESAGAGQGSGSRAVAATAGRTGARARASARQGCRTRHVIGRRARPNRARLSVPHRSERHRERQTHQSHRPPWPDDFPLSAAEG